MVSISDSPKLCECGCGGVAPIAPQTFARLGCKKGQPMRYIRGHNTKGIERTPLAIRFWSKVTKTEGCWLWTASKRTSGHGNFKVGRRAIPAQRVAYELCVGPIPEGLFVCHKCDNPPCVNPEHLFLGTHADNMRDKVAKGRQSAPKGEKHRLAKFTDAQVLEVRALYSGGADVLELADKYHVDDMTMCNLLRRKTWRHLP